MSVSSRLALINHVTFTFKNLNGRCQNETRRHMQGPHIRVGWSGDVETTRAFEKNLFSPSRLERSERTGNERRVRRTGNETDTGGGRAGGRAGTGRDTARFKHPYPRPSYPRAPKHLSDSTPASLILLAGSSSFLKPNAHRKARRVRRPHLMRDTLVAPKAHESVP